MPFSTSDLLCALVAGLLALASPAQAFDQDDWFTDQDSDASMQVTFFGNHDEGRMGHFVDVSNPLADDAELLRAVFEAPGTSPRTELLRDALGQQAQRFLWGEIDGRYDELLAHHELATCRLVGRQTIAGPNWKVAYDGYRPPSILEMDGALDVAVEFHSFSKTYNMTGWPAAVVRCGTSDGGLPIGVQVVAAIFVIALVGEAMEFVTDFIWRSPLGLRINRLRNLGAD